MKSKPLPILIAAFLLAGALGGYLYFHGLTPDDKQTLSAPSSGPESPVAEFSVLRISYPVKGTLRIIEKKTARKIRQSQVAEAVLEEFFKGPSDTSSETGIPRDVRVLGVYTDPGGMLTADLSDEARKEFQGDALSEYLLLKGIYESLMANLQEIQDVKLLVEGKEIDSLGGHFSLRLPLKGIVSQEPAEEAPSSE